MGIGPQSDNSEIIGIARVKEQEGEVAPYNILNHCASVAWAGSSGSAAEAASFGAKPHRARQGYAAGFCVAGSEESPNTWDLTIEDTPTFAPSTLV